MSSKLPTPTVARKQPVTKLFMLFGAAAKASSKPMVETKISDVVRSTNASAIHHSDTFSPLDVVRNPADAMTTYVNAMARKPIMIFRVDGNFRPLGSIHLNNKLITGTII